MWLREEQVNLSRVELKELIYHLSLWKGSGTQKTVVKKCFIITSQWWWVTVFNDNDRHRAQWQICWFISSLSLVACKREIKHTVNIESSDCNWQKIILSLIWANFSSSISGHNGYHCSPFWMYWFGGNLWCQVWKSHILFTNVCCKWNEQMLECCSSVFSNRALVPFFSSSLFFNPPYPSIFPCCLILPPACLTLSFSLLFHLMDLLYFSRLRALCCGFAERLSGVLQAMEEMDSKPYQPLSKGRHEMEMSYTSSSDESEDGRTHHRSYTSRETLPDYTHELRLTLGSHRERQNNYSQPQPGTWSWSSWWQTELFSELPECESTVAQKRHTYISRHNDILTTHTQRSP